MNHARAEEQVSQWRRQVNDARQAVQEVQHRVEVAKALRPAQALAEQRVVDAKDLGHAARPANALPDMARQAFGRQARRLRQREVRGAVAEPMDLERGVRVFGHRLGGDTADLFADGPPQHGARAAKEGRVPEVVAVLDEAVEQLAFVRHCAEGIEVLLERIGREEVVRQLHHAELGLAVEPAQCDLHERPRRDVVAVEDGDELTAGVLQRGVDVAGLGVLVVGAGDVRDTDRLAEHAELFAPPVVQHEDVDLVARPVDGLRGKHRRAHHRQWLVVGRDEDVDGRPDCRVGRHGYGLAAERPSGLDIAEQQHDEGVDLRHQQTRAEHDLERAVHGHRLGHAPVHVARRCHHRKKDQHQAGEASGKAVDDETGDQNDNRQRELLVQRQRRDDDGGQ